MEEVSAGSAEATTGSYAELPADHPYPGVSRKTLDAAGATVTDYTFAPGASFPVHEHPQEQITLVLEGSVHVRIADRTEELAAGAWSVIPGGIEHGLTAGPEGARITAIIVPRRARVDAP